MSLVESMASDRFLLASWKFARRTLKGVRNSIDMGIGSATRSVIFRDCKADPKKIVFMTYNDAYMCNPKYIAEEIIKRGLPYDLVWATPNNVMADLSQYPAQLRLVKRGTYEFFKELVTARVWVDNALNCEWSSLEKRDDQVYFNTWHGSMGLKRIGVDDVPGVRWKKSAKRVSKYVDYAISDSEFENMVYRSTHFADTKILEYGHPRNDALCIPDENRDSALRARLAKKFGFSPEDKLLIYAPTFRDSGSTAAFDVDFDKVIEALEERFGGTWKVLVRMHFHDRNQVYRPKGKYSARAVDVTEHIDMQELLLIADAGLTDYSSWCCDYVLTGRPCFLYTPDLAEYEKARGFYYPLSETPFPLARTNKQLAAAIRAFDEEAYAAGCSSFLEARGSFEDGKAAERVVDKIVEVIEGRSA